MDHRQGWELEGSLLLMRITVLGYIIADRGNMVYQHLSARFHSKEEFSDSDTYNAHLNKP